MAPLAWLWFLITYLAVDAQYDKGGKLLDIELTNVSSVIMP